MSVGCVITNVKYSKVLGLGYNGNAAGLPNECDSPEPGNCGCIHAETNAIVKCGSDVDKIVFCTHQPCADCAKLLINLGGVKFVFYENEYRVKDGLYILGEAGIHAEQRSSDFHEKPRYRRE